MIVKLKDNCQMRIALKYISAKESPGKHGGRGIEYLYTLANGNLIYVSAQGHQEIQSLKPMAGEWFLLAKRIGAGNQVIWSVERIQQPDTPGPKPMAHAIAAASPVPIPPSLTTPESVRLFQQLCAVLLATKAAEEFGDSIGYPVKFTETSIRAMAISNSIAAQGQSRRAA